MLLSTVHCLFFDMIRLIWNCQGAASRAFGRTLKQLCRIHRPAIVCLLEPKVSSDQANKICANLGFDEWIRVEAVGFSGGIWVLWNNYLKIEVLDTHPQFINLEITEGQRDPWILTGLW